MNLHIVPRMSAQPGSMIPPQYGQLISLDFMTCQYSELSGESNIVSQLWYAQISN